nr:phage scaffolding protein [uncultured Fusobacterium sp.]
MKKEELLELGLSEELANKVVEKYGHLVTKTRLDEVIAERDSYKTQLTDRDKQLKELEKSVGDNAELKEKVEKLQAENKTAAEKYEKNLYELQVNNAVELAITGAKGKNNKAIKALLNLEKAEIKDGKIVGLDEQLKKLQETEAYLFEETKENKVPAGFAPAAGNNGSQGGVSGNKTYSEIMSMLAANPGLDISKL